MKPHALFSWEDWWVQIVKDGEAPRHKTYAYSQFIDKRNKIKQQVNKELEKRKRPERLMCPGVGAGVYLVDEADVAELTTDQRIRKIVNTFENSQKQMSLLAASSRLSESDKSMLLRIAGLVELQQTSMIGTMARMKSLPPASKKRLLKHLGVVDKKNRKKS
jgi:hypothetical protein